MAADEIGPVPSAALLAGAADSDIPPATVWLNNLLSVIQRTNAPTAEGNSLQMANVAKLTQSISNPPTQAEVTAIQDKLNEFIDAAVNSLKMEA